MSGITMEQTARIAAVSLQTLRSWRHYSPVLGDLGSRESGQLRFDIGEVALFAPTSEMTKTGKTQPEAVAAALVWLPALARLLDGSADGGDHYGAELVAPDGTSVRYLAVGPDDLAAIVKASSGAASVSVVNLSALMHRVLTGVLIARLGRDKARADLETSLTGHPAEARDAYLAAFDKIAASMAAEPATARKAKYHPANPGPMPVPVSDELSAAVNVVH